MDQFVLRIEQFQIKLQKLFLIILKRELVSLQLINSAIGKLQFAMRLFNAEHPFFRIKRNSALALFYAAFFRKRDGQIAERNFSGPIRLRNLPFCQTMVINLFGPAGHFTVSWKMERAELRITAPPPHSSFFL